MCAMSMYIKRLRAVYATRIGRVCDKTRPWKCRLYDKIRTTCDKNRVERSGASAERKRN